MNAGSRISRIREGCGLCPTRHLCVARDLPDSAQEALGERLSTTAPMGKGDFLYRTGDEAKNWYVVRSGVFKTVTVTPDGEEYVTGFHYPGEILGLDGPATGTHRDTAVALGVSTACSIGLNQLPEIWELGAGASLLQLIAEHERNESMLRINLSQSRAEARIAGFLKLLMDRTERLGFDPTVLSMPMSRTDLANHLGLTLECVSRVLSKWRRAGVIDADRTTMKIVEAEALNTAAYHLAA